MPQWPCLPLATDGSQEIHPLEFRAPSTWAIFYFPNCINRELVWKEICWDLNQLWMKEKPLICGGRSGRSPREYLPRGEGASWGSCQHAFWLTCPHLVHRGDVTWITTYCCAIWLRLGLLTEERSGGWVPASALLLLGLRLRNALNHRVLFLTETKALCWSWVN